MKPVPFVVITTVASDNTRGTEEEKAGVTRFFPPQMPREGATVISLFPFTRG